jgi:protein-S-isoprenylcysteine O-methyltransferase Ste14
MKLNEDICQMLKGVARILLVLTFVGAVLFMAAGNISWMSAWLVVLFFVGYLTLVMIWGVRNSPELIVERGKIEGNVKFWDKIINLLYAVILISMLVVAGFDSQRYGWTTLPIGLQVLGFVGMFCSSWLIWRSMSENAYASRWARIQEDRRQQVVATGPYSYVRHPMYLGVIVLVFSSSLALGSLLGFVPGALIGSIYVLRTSLEDRMLKEELDGYEEYAISVRYRLIPGIW